MSRTSEGVTVEQLAELIDIPLERLKLQLEKAGIPPSSMITEKQKKELLAFLKRDHGEESLEPKKITLKRKSVSEIKVQRSSGKKGTVSVVRKRRHVYVKKEAKALEEEGKIEAAPLSEEASAEALKHTAQVIGSLPETDTFVPEESLKTIKEEKPESSKLTEGNTAAEITETSGAQSASQPGTPEISTASAIAIPSEAKPDKALGSKPKGRGHRGSEEEESARGRAKPAKGRGPEPKEWKKTKFPRGGAVSLLVNDEEEDANVAVSRRPRPKARSTGRFSAEVPVTRARKEIQKRHIFEKPQGPIKREVLVPETVTVSELALKMSVKAAEVIKVLMKMGTMATINQPLDQATASLVVEELGHTAKLLKDTTVEDELQLESQEELQARGPVVTVMGHVDHGKTSLLDYIRRTRVAAKEAGGITQHIGAYHVETKKGSITFLDTPGHAAFSAMRSRGVRCTDIVVLVVAADDGVKPQTVEAIKHAKAANVPIVVAVNKIDKPEADLDRVNNDLSQQGLLPESWGGDVMFIPVSAKEGTGIDALLDAIALQAEMLELKAPVKGLAKGVVLEARLDKGRGPISSVLVQKGTLNRGDIILAGVEFGRVRAMMNELGQEIASAGPSIPVEILGLSGTPNAGDAFQVVKDERKAREIALFRQTKSRDVRMLKQNVASSLEGLFDRLQQSDTKVLKIVLKADVQGSSEAIAEALEALSTDEIKVKIISQGVGGINESDVTLAMASEALLIGFNVRADGQARRLAEKEGVTIEYFSIIYDVVDGVKRAINGMLGPEFKEKILGTAEVRDVFRSAKIGAIAGCMVIEGIVKRGCPIRVLRNNVVIYQGELESLRRFKEDVSEVRHGMECGIGVKNYNDVKTGDHIEVYEVVQVSRTQS